MNYYTERRKRIAEALADRSVLILFSGVELHVSEDEYYPFEVNHHFHCMTGLDQPKQGLLM